MILTGKAKEEFLNFYGTGENYFKTTLQEIEQHANIIEWFDSVGIIIEIEYSYLLSDKFYCVVSHNRDYVGTSYTESRKKAITQAITKANEIYNEKWK